MMQVCVIFIMQMFLPFNACIFDSFLLAETNPDPKLCVQYLIKDDKLMKDYER